MRQKRTCGSLPISSDAALFRILLHVPANDCNGLFEKVAEAQIAIKGLVAEATPVSLVFKNVTNAELAKPMLTGKLVNGMTSLEGQKNFMVSDSLRFNRQVAAPRKQ